MKGIFIQNATVPKSCYECEYGMGSQVECPYYERPIENDLYKEERHPNCIIKEIEISDEQEELEEVL